MTFQDKNQTLEAPVGYKFSGSEPMGAFLRVEYRRQVEARENILTIYLNDMGREVARSEHQVLLPLFAPVTRPAPVARRFRIKNGFLIMLQGIQEMFR
jgi:hypothetical protein